MNIKERIFLFIEYKNMSKLAFERACGLSNGYLKNFKGNIGEEKLNNILNAFPELDKYWLLTGEGSMLRGVGVVGGSVVNSGNSEQARTEELERLIAMQAERINELKEHIALLKEQNELLKSRPSILSGGRMSFSQCG